MIMNLLQKPFILKIGNSRQPAKQKEMQVVCPLRSTRWLVQQFISAVRREVTANGYTDYAVGAVACECLILIETTGFGCFTS